MTYPTNQIPSNNPQNIGLANPVGLQIAARSPTAQDNTFVPGSEWLNTVTGLFYKCSSSTISGAVWLPFAGNTSGTVDSLTGNDSTVVGPDISGNINVKGDATTIYISGNAGTNTLTESVVAASNALLVGTGLSTAAVSLTTGNNGVLISSNSGAPSWLANGTAGQVLTANTAAPPSWQATSGGVTSVTGTANQISASPTTGAVVLSLIGPYTPASYNAYGVLLGGTTSTGSIQSLSSTGTSGQVLTSNGVSSQPTWQTANFFLTITTPAVNHSASPYTVLTTDQFIPVDVTTAPAGTVTILLPNAPSTGRVFYIKDKNGGAFTSNITVTTVGGSVLIDAAATFVMNANYQAIAIIFDGTKYQVF